MSLLRFSRNRTNILRSRGFRIIWNFDRQYTPLVSEKELVPRTGSTLICVDQPGQKFLKHCIPQIRGFATRKIIVDGAVISVDDGKWQSDGATPQNTGQNSVAVLCLLKSHQRASEILLLSKYRSDLGAISIEPPACRLLDRENFKDAAFREVKATTGYSITKFAQSTSSATVYSDIMAGTTCSSKLILAEIDLSSFENQNAKLVHELGEKITVVRIPLGMPCSILCAPGGGIAAGVLTAPAADGLVAGLDSLASEGRAINSWLYSFAQVRHRAV